MRRQQELRDRYWAALGDGSDDSIEGSGRCRSRVADRKSAQGSVRSQTFDCKIHECARLLGDMASLAVHDVDRPRRRLVAFEYPFELALLHMLGDLVRQHSSDTEPVE